MSNRFPASVRILGRTFEISKEPLDEGLCGLCYPAGQRILVAPEQSPLEEVDTVLHESIHAVEYLLDLRMSEKQVRLLATALVGIFQDNPEFARYITDPRP